MFIQYVRRRRRRGDLFIETHRERDETRDEVDGRTYAPRVSFLQLKLSQEKDCGRDGKMPVTAQRAHISRNEMPSSIPSDFAGLVRCRNLDGRKSMSRTLKLASLQLVHFGEGRLVSMKQRQTARQSDPEVEPLVPTRMYEKLLTVSTNVLAETRPSGPRMQVGHKCGG